MDIASVFRLFATVFWFVAFGVLALSLIRAGQNRPIQGSRIYIGLSFIAALIFTSLGMGMVFVEPQERGVVISAVAPQGYREEALQPGLNWIIPGLERVVYYSTQKQTYTMSIVPSEGQVVGDDSIYARTSDGQQVLIDASVIYKIDPTKVVQIHIDWQDRFSTDFIRPVSRAAIRDAVSQFGVEEVYSSKRDELSAEITTNLAVQLENNGLILEQFLLRNITFSDEYAASVEQKQIAEQQAQQAKFVVEQRKQEAEQERQRAQGIADAAVIQAKADAESRLIQAQAEADALNLIAAALQDNQNLLAYQYITKLSPNMQVMLLPSDSPFIIPLPEMEQSTITTTPTVIPTVVPTEETNP